MYTDDCIPALDTKMSAEEIVVKEKKEKKDKKEKKSKSKKHGHEEDANTEVAIEDADVAEEGADPKKDKKRKREAIPEELEIDVSLPEPPSKKTARKAKKAKTEKSSSSKREAKEIKDDDDNEEEQIEEAPEDTKPHREKEERKTEHSIWIGNLPWTATKDDLRSFLEQQAAIPPTRITRLHMPPPSAAASRDTKGRPAFKNRGFAYVDFDSEEMLFAALQVTETPFNNGGRNVLVKNAKSFEGRPDEHAKKEKNAEGGFVSNKPPSKRVFIGNLAFEITKEDLQTHFEQCGEVENIHMATFEDSGKCKGYAWITFATLGAAESAVRGFVLKEQEAADDEEDGDHVHSERAQNIKGVKKPKPRKWFVNRFQGREIKREFAEDASTRYNKRYGKGRPRAEGEAGNVDDSAPISGAREAGRPQKETSSHDRRREQRRQQKYGDGYKKVDARTIAPGAALSHAPRASAAISSEGTKGTKVTFD